jgi:YesN/AraC family two-component response regulator
LKKNILIVDDEEMIIEFLESVFKSKKKYSCYTAKSGEEALKVIESESIDLVLTDVKMAGMDGIELLLEVKCRYPKIHVIIMTAYSSAAMKKIAVQRGAIHFIEKPFDIYFLLDYVYKLFHQQKNYSGIVQEINIIDIIQMLCLSQADKVIQVHYEHNKHHGEIYIENGKLISSRFGELQGEEAFNSILNEKHGSFQVLPFADSPKQNIFKSWGQLVLDKYNSDDDEYLEMDDDNSVKLQFESIEEYSDYFVNQVEHISSVLVYNLDTDLIINLNGKMEKKSCAFLNKIFLKDKDIDDFSYKRLNQKYYAKRINDSTYMLLTGNLKLNIGIASMLTEKHQNELKELLFLIHK